MMINYMEVIENELKILQTESKKKYSQVRDASNEALTIFVNYRKEVKDKQPNLPFPLNEVLKPVLLVPPTKNSKLIAQGLCIVQKLITYDLIPDKQFLTILNFLSQLLEIQEENLHIKLLQTILLFITPKKIDLNSIEIVQKLLNICLQIIYSKNAAIQKPALAALFQLSGIICDNLIICLKNSQGTVEKSPNYCNCIKLSKEFVMLANGLRPEWVPVNIPAPRNIGIDIIITMLKHIGPLLRNSKEIHTVIKKELVPILLTSFETKANDFLSLLRIMSASTRIIIDLNDGYELLEQIINMMHTTEIDFERYLCLEAINLACGQSDILYMLNEKCISTISFLTEILNQFTNILKMYSGLPDSEIKKSNANLFKIHKPLEINPGDFDASYFPPVNNYLILKTIVDCITSISESFLVLCEKFEVKLGALNINTKSSNTLLDQAKLTEWININWKILSKSLQILLPREIDESVTQQLLNNFQSWINISGSLKLTQVRDAFLSMLCSACLPIESAKEFTTKHIQITKTLFNIAHCLGDILDAGSWHIILTTFQKTEMFFSRSKTQLSGKKGQSNDDNYMSTDMIILNSALETLFTQSHTCSNENLYAILEALSQLSLDFMQKITTSEGLNIEGIAYEGKIKIFGLSKMLDTILVNLFRIELYWDLVIAHFVCVSGSKNHILRTNSIENLSMLIHQVFPYYLNKKFNNNKLGEITGDTTVVDLTSPNNISTTKTNNSLDEEPLSSTGKTKLKIKDDDNRWTKENWQGTIFLPWIDVCKSKFPDIKENVSQSLLKFIQNNGHEINVLGWNAILNILNEISSEYYSGITSIGFKCLEMIINDYLQTMNLECYKILIQVVDNFKKASNENNISYLAVGMFWNVADSLIKLQKLNGGINTQKQAEYEEVWAKIFTKLIAVCSDKLSELRQSALHIFSSIIIHHGQIFSTSMWNMIMHDKIFTLIDHILEIYISLIKVNPLPLETPKFRTDIKIAFEDTQKGGQDEKMRLLQQKQWEDTIIASIQNLVKIKRKYVSLCEASDSQINSNDSIQILKMMLVKLKNVMMMSRNELTFESLKFFHDMILIKPEILAQIIETVFEVISVIKSCFLETRQDSKEIKMMINKFIPEVLEIVNDLFNPIRYQIINTSKYDYTKQIFEILEKAILYPKQAETFNSISPNKIITDDILIYEFLEKLPQTISEKNPKIMNQYFEFLMNIMNYEVLDKFTDIVVRKIISLIQTIICNKTVDEQYYLPHLSMILDKMKRIMCLRCDNKFLTLMVNAYKNSLPIWLYTVDYFIKIVINVFMNYEARNETINKNASKSNSGGAVKSVDDSKIVDNCNEETKKINEMYQNAIRQIIDIYEKVLKNTEQAAENISKGIFSEIKKDWFEMDMKFINSIGDVIVPHFYILDQELLWKLINILDFTFSFYSKSNFFADQNSYSKYGSSAGESSTNSTISKISLEILFKIAENFDDEKQLKGEYQNANTGKKKCSLSRMATKKLLMKCKSIVKNFITDEKKSGGMPLPRNRLNEIIYIFDKLRKLTIPNNCFEYVDKIENISNINDENIDINYEDEGDNVERYGKIRIYHESKKTNDLLQSRKGHLIYFLPLFAECIISKEMELKESLKEIFKEVSKELGLELI